MSFFIRKFRMGIQVEAGSDQRMGQDVFESCW